MASDAVLNPAMDVAESESWLPMIAIARGQALMSFDIASLPVAIGGMVTASMCRRRRGDPRRPRRGCCRKH